MLKDSGLVTSYKKKNNWELIGQQRKHLDVTAKRISYYYDKKEKLSV